MDHFRRSSLAVMAFFQSTEEGIIPKENHTAGFLCRGCLGISAIHSLTGDRRRWIGRHLWSRQIAKEIPPSLDDLHDYSQPDQLCRLAFLVAKWDQILLSGTGLFQRVSLALVAVALPSTPLRGTM